MTRRLIVNHPFTIFHPVDAENCLLISNKMIQASGKLAVLDAMLKKLQKSGHRVLIFTFFKKVLDILEDYATFRNYTHVILSGDTSLEDRKRSINK